MSAPIDNGGPAFPTENARQTGPSSWHEEGMSLRDYFAAKAMQMQPWHGLHDSYLNHADRCYAMADAMLKAREA